MTFRSEADFLAQYNARDFASPLVTVDLAIFTLHEGQLQVLLVKRGDYPHKGRWALPGGFVDLVKDADIEATAHRKLREKTGVKAGWLEQVASIGNARRDPRGWSVTLLYMALIPYVAVAGAVKPGHDARWWPVVDAVALKLAFDHAALLQLARDRLKNKTAYTVLPMHVLQRPFTLAQLQQAFEELMDSRLEKKSFRRRMMNADLLKEVGEGLPEGGRGRPAALYEPAEGSEQHLFVRVFGDER